MASTMLSGDRPVSVAEPPLRGSGRQPDPAWVRPCLIALLAATALLYLWGLGASGWANDFYSAAVQAATKSWKAFFFGSSDGANFITVDKAPAALWVMGISARLFGVNAWSILVPQALAGVASVAVLYATVRRWFRPGAALLAGAVLAATPVAALMFRFNNPDALLVLLLIGSAYATTRAVESGKTKWLVLAGALVGFGFLAKMLQALLVVPALGITYLVAGPTPLRRRIAQLLAGAAAMVAAGGWWVAIVELIPPSRRPYIGGSQDNSVFNLLFGYNGFGRLTGNEAGSVGGQGPSRQPVGPDRVDPDVQRRVRRADQLAAAGRGAAAGGHARDHPRGASHEPDPRRHAPVGRLARDHGGHVQPRPGDHPPVLLRGPGARHRCRRGHRRRAPLEPAGRPGGAGAPGRDRRGDGGVVLLPARAHARMAPGPPDVGARGRARHLHRSPGRRPVEPSSAGRGRGRRPRLRTARAQRLHRRHRGHAPLRCHPLGRSRRRRLRLRPRPGWRRWSVP